MNYQELRIARSARDEYSVTGRLFPADQRISAYYRTAQDLAHHISRQDPRRASLRPSSIYAAGLLCRIHFSLINHYTETVQTDIFSRTVEHLRRAIPGTPDLLKAFEISFPPGEPLRTKQADTLQHLLLTAVARQNPALTESLDFFYDDAPLRKHASYYSLVNRLFDFLGSLPPVDSSGKSLTDFLLEPARRHPHDLTQQLLYIQEHWRELIPDLAEELLRAADFIREETRPSFGPGRGENHTPDYSEFGMEVEQFSRDSNWMPRVVMLAKSALVWLDQLSKQYGRPIARLDEIPEQELDLLAERGFTALWLIGLWERSTASRVIKHRCGNPEAEASAYSLKRYDIAESLGGWHALATLRHRCSSRGIRLASDMVPNHTGLDSDWMISQPDLFLQESHPPFPAYRYDSEGVCRIGDVEVCIEDRYYDRTDAAVTCRRTDHSTGDVRYIYHGNDGTSTPWNDTAQLDYLNPRTRETVIRTIIHVAKNFPIIRFDAAMTLAKRHIQRLWYPKPGQGGDIPGRSAYGMTDAEFHRAIPNEFWREVVDRVAAEAPDTLLLAEAFWMMEGYFVRTLGMHRVYNSAFMNMLKLEEDEKYRNMVKHTLSFDPEILKRFVNFMNNPDEDTAVDQFGDGDKYFGVTTLLVTMPGLPMFGHGQVEGYREKYGMEYTKAYWNEHPNQHLVDEHYRRIFPLIKLRPLFAEASRFRIYDFFTHNGVNEHVYAYTNGLASQRALVLYNNAYESTAGWFSESAPFLEKNGGEPVHRTETLADALGASQDSHAYMIFRDPIRGLTYLRSSLEIRTRGMYAELRGYETQIYLDFREIADTQGLYHELAGLLQGRGTPNFEHELALLRLRPIHAWISPFVESDQLALIRHLMEGNTTVFDGIKQRWLALYRGLLRTWNTEFKADEHSVLPAQLPQAALRYLLETIDSLSGTFSRISRSRSALETFIRTSLRVMPELPAVITAAVITLPIAKTVPGGSQKAWTTPLLLQSVFDQPLAEAGVVPERQNHVLRGAEFFIRFSQWTGRLEQPDASPRQLLEELFSDQLFREYTGCNWHEGIQWFHRESFQEALVLLGLVYLLNSREDQKARRQVFSILYLWYTLEPGSAYQVSRLLESAEG